MSFFFLDDAPGVSSVAFQASATSTAATITCPTVQQYDVGVLIDFAGDSASLPTQTVPSGFTSLISSTVSTYRGTASYKIFSGTESGSALTGQNGNQFDSKVLLVFRPNAPIGTVTASTWLGEATSANPTAQSIAAASQQVPLVRIAGASDNNSATPSFAAGTFDGTVTQSTGTGRTIAGYTVQNTSGSTDSVDMNDFGTNWLVSGWLSFS